MVKVTQAEFKRFQRYCSEFIKLFGLIDWRVLFDFKRIDRESNAECYRDYQGCIVTITLNKVIEDPKELKRIALHEVIHILVADLSHLCYNRFITQDVISKEEERLVRRLENALLGVKI